MDENFRKVTHSLEQLRAKKNTVSEMVALAKRNGENSDEKIKEMRDLGDEIKILEAESNTIKLDLNIIA